ncbi:restriction endonuclease subunit S [Pseudomonas amygdali]|uniref:restriction endonuclease subunit S n=1 Tax=Pseudomonas amygdali TaxID=47877 RepID=UPI000CD11E38|nr:restriction endonuclease subunit S [Pseudomonas amygdali]POC98500.1 restriction endonuclease subunit S [Pseudomonas amygdali pv. morsprunorum]POD38342.1 restriction endonuclease subunit S [Pseudomonas amygdali pv. morsprunorum]POD40316.1 restriction endonuclease subunit S [Pseudomonas amygdali pv. morsprunorum]
MSSEWTFAPLESCLEALIDYRGKTPEKTDSGIPLITAKIIKRGRIEKATEFIAEGNYASWMRRGIPKEGDIVLTVEAPLGEVAQLGSEKIALAQRVVTLRGKEGVLDNTYLLYLLQTEEMLDQLKARATGTTVLGIKQSELRKVPLSLPPIAQQRSAASILKTLDDRLTLLRETNATLETIAQSLFKSWFVDFDPVRAKAEGFEPEGMDAATAALFPDSFEESELGLVPMGWRMLPLEDAYEINPPRKLKKGKVAPYLDMASVSTQGHVVSGVVEREMGSGTKFINGDTLLARITPCLENGKSAFVDFLSVDQTGWGSTEFVVLRPRAPLPPYHGYLLARHPAFREHAIQSMSGTSGRQRVQNDVLGRYSVAVPSDEIAEAFGDVVGSAQQKIAACQEQAKTLTHLRDTLLPRLISGQLRLPEAEVMVEEICA